MLRKLFLIIFLLLILVVVGIAVFIATFNADHYRPLVVSKIEEALGTSVEIERLTLKWTAGAALEIRGLVVQDPAQPAGEALLQVDTVSAFVQLMPLLQRRVEVASVVLNKPVVHVARDRSGEVNLTGLAAAGSPVAAGAQAPASQPAQTGEQAISLRISSVRIKEGRVHWTDATLSPPMDVWVNALDVTVRDLSPGQPFRLAARAALGAETPNIQADLMIDPPQGEQKPGAITNAKIQVDRLPVEKLLPPAAAGQPTVKGLLTARFDGKLPTLAPEVIANTLTGTAEIDFAEGVLVNVNVLRSVFEQMSTIPLLSGFAAKAQTELSPEYRQRLQEKDTPLRAIEASLAIDSGRVRFDDIQAGTRELAFAGSGTAMLPGTVQAQGKLLFDETLTAAVIRSVKELHPLVNREGALEFPVVVQVPGRVPVSPDLNYITQRLAVGNASDLIGELIRRGMGGEEQGMAQPRATTPQQPGTQQYPAQTQPGTPGAPTQSQTPQEPVDPFAQILQRVLQEALRDPNSSSQTPQQ